MIFDHFLNVEDTDQNFQNSTPAQSPFRTSYFNHASDRQSRHNSPKIEFKSSGQIGDKIGENSPILKDCSDEVCEGDSNQERGKRGVLENGKSESYEERERGRERGRGSIILLDRNNDYPLYSTTNTNSDKNHYNSGTTIHSPSPSKIVDRRLFATAGMTSPILAPSTDLYSPNNISIHHLDDLNGSCIDVCAPGSLFKNSGARGTGRDNDDVLHDIEESRYLGKDIHVNDKNRRDKGSVVNDRNGVNEASLLHRRGVVKRKLTDISTSDLIDDLSWRCVDGDRIELNDVMSNKENEDCMVEEGVVMSRDHEKTQNESKYENTRENVYDNESESAHENAKEHSHISGSECDEDKIEVEVQFGTYAQGQPVFPYRKQRSDSIR